VGVAGIARGFSTQRLSQRVMLEVAARLIEEGIPKDRIVLGFQTPYKRTLEGFASGQ
jgi:XisI protein